MLPVYPFDNTADRGAINPVLFSKGSVAHNACGVLGSHRKNLLFVNLGIRAFRATGEGFGMGVVAVPRSTSNVRSSSLSHLVVVLPLCAGGQMSRVTAGRIVAAVSHAQAFGNRAVRYFPCDTVNEFRYLGDSHDSIPCSVGFAGPDPTRSFRAVAGRFVYLGPETFLPVLHLIVGAALIAAELMTGSLEAVGISIKRSVTRGAFSVKFFLSHFISLLGDLVRAVWSVDSTLAARSIIAQD